VFLKGANPVRRQILLIKDNKGQGTAVEYVLIFFVVMAVISGMTVYVRRVLQARAVDTLHYMANTVAVDYSGPFRYQYEPYYMNVNSTKVIDAEDIVGEKQGVPGAGIAEFQYNDWTRQKTTAVQLPPAFGD
jgi:hypothetical protein